MPIATPQGTLDFKSVDTITFVGASSNTVIDTTTGSLGVGVGVGGPTSNLHVVGHTRLEGDINMLHTSNTASIKLNSNVVTEFPRSKKLIKYPRVAMTQNDESGTSGYVASASATNPTRDPYRAFDNVLYSSWHEPVYQVNPYPNFDGAYTGGSGTVYDTNGYQGEYLQIQLPEKIKLYNYSISNRAAAGIEGRQPKDAKIFASNDGTTWIDIHTHSDGGGTYDIVGETRSFQLDNITETHYKYYRLVINSIIQGGSSDTANISQWKLYGIPEYDPEAHGTDVVVKSLPNVPNTDWLEVYYDAKDLATMPNTVTDLSPNTNTGAVSGHSPTLDTAGGVNSFVFDGTDDYITSTLTGLSSTQYTMAGWIKVNTLDSTVNTFFGLGDWASGDGRAIGIAITGDNVIGANVKGLADAKFSEVTTGEWYHVVADFTSGNDTHLYVNGKLVDTVAGTTFAIPTNPPLFIGSRANASGTVETARLFPGSIANFRLFNRALTSDEVWQLYAYQKEYFGHGNLGMTLKAGRLGIGTSEPRAALDVRGDIYGGMPVFFDVRFTSAPTATHAGNRIVFDTINNSRGGGFDTSTGTFTAPIAGVYKFSYFMRGNILNQSIKIKPRINGSPTFNTTSDGTDQNLLGTAFAGNDGIQGSAVCIVSLEVGGTFELIACTHGGTVSSALASLYSGFTGEYISSL